MNEFEKILSNLETNESFSFLRKCGDAPMGKLNKEICMKHVDKDHISVIER